ncbi:hypothetical protein AAG747_26705 [Rapidithrix thailandica]|uniref:Uncharacterized protein n=1 Tax=Rapidithrix thailandica TaxID=413964 RepID=A0AAW9S5M3_9BACT
MKEETPLICPVKTSHPELTFDYSELEPLLHFLEEDREVEGVREFQRGTVIAGGKLDCCKQNLGPAGAHMLSKALQKNTTIQSILFGTGGIGNEGAKSVAGLIAQNQYIRTVYLGCNLIESQGVEYLSQALTDNTSVRALWLKRNPVGVEGARKIAGLLKQNSNIRTLDLVNTRIGYQGVKYLVEVLLENNYPLEILYLSGNTLDSRAAVLLAELVANSTSLKELLLSVNNLGDNGAVQLAKGLSQNQHLLNLGLASNGIQARGGAAIFKALSHHPQLQQLDLGYAKSTKVLNALPNQIGEEGAKALYGFLVQNKKLLKLNLSKNQLERKELDGLLEGLSKNTVLQKLILGKGYHKEVKEQIRQLTEQNAQTGKDLQVEIHEDVLAIKSVYR